MYLYKTSIVCSVFMSSNAWHALNSHSVTFTEQTKPPSLFYLSIPPLHSPLTPLSPGNAKGYNYHPTFCYPITRQTMTLFMWKIKNSVLSFVIKMIKPLSHSDTFTWFQFQTRLCNKNYFLSLISYVLVSFIYLFILFFAWFLIYILLLYWFVAQSYL